MASSFIREQRTEVLSRLRRAFNQRAAQRHTKICLLSSDGTSSHLTKLTNNVSQVIGYVFCPLSSAYAVEGARSAYTPPPPAVSSGSIVQIIFSLLLVLAAIVLVAWLLKRMNVAQQGSGNLLKVLGSVAVGQRERIVLVEVNDTCLVVGVGPGQIRTLHTFQKQENIGQNTDASSSQSAGKPKNFSAFLSSALSSLSHGKHKQQLAAEANMSEANVKLANASGQSHNAP